MLDYLVSGIWGLDLMGQVVFTLVVTHITIVAVTVYLHRSQAHRSVDVHPVVGVFFRVWIWLTTTMVTTQWVAVHRKHHAKVETEGDPHSPRVYGIWAILFNGVHYYRKGKKVPGVLDKYSVGCPNDWFERALMRSRIFQYSGVVIVLALNVMLFGAINGSIIWGIQMLWIPALAAGVINGLGHYLGYRNYTTDDDSTNISPWGILIGGEELHNNHHAFPTSPKLSSKWYEFDLGYKYIQLLSCLGLATIKQKPMSIDGVAGQVSDVIRAKVLILSKFSKQVVNPILKKKKSLFSGSKIGSYHGVRRVLGRPFSFMNDLDIGLLKNIMTKDVEIKWLYVLKERLEGIYAKRLKAVELIKEIDEWCAQAKASGVDALKQYADHLSHFISGVKSESV